MPVKSNTARTSRLDQDATLDLIANGGLQKKQPRRTPLSLQMGSVVSFGNAVGEKLAKALVAAWKPNTKVVIMAAEKFDELSERSITFHGLAADLG